MESLTEADRPVTPPFPCTHAICAACDTALFVRADDRCPICRAPRTYNSKLCRSRTPNEMSQRVRQSQRVRDHLAGIPLPETVFFPVEADFGAAPFPAPYPVFFGEDGADAEAEADTDTETDLHTQEALLMDARALMVSARATSAAVVAQNANLPGLPIPVLASLRSDPSVVGAMHALVNVPAVNINAFAVATDRLRQARRSVSVSVSVASRRPTTRAHGPQGTVAEQ